MIKNLSRMSNVFFESYKNKQLYHNLFNIHRRDYDGYVLSAALFMKLCYPFRKVIMLSEDKELNMRCQLMGIGIRV